MTTQPQPEWARKIAKARIITGYRTVYCRGYNSPFSPADYLVDLLAEMIVKTELPPADPDELFVCDFLNVTFSDRSAPRGWSVEKTKAISPKTFAAALAFYKASKAEKKGPGDGPSN